MIRESDMYQKLEELLETKEIKKEEERNYLPDFTELPTLDQEKSKTSEDLLVKIKMLKHKFS